MTKQVYAGMGLGALLLFILIGFGAYVSSKNAAPGPDEGSVAAATVEQFTERMRSKVVAEIGQPIEGYEPFMFMRVYPGLTAQDFAGVDALIGLYRYQNGQVVYDLNGEPELHSAARAISDEGMTTLLLNIAKRLSVELEGNGTLADIFAAIEVAPGNDPTNNPAAGGIEPSESTIAITGTLACLPHKGDGPHTMECAYGLKADNGKYYALKNLFNEPGPWPLDINDRVSITGEVATPDANEKYDIVGVIDVTTAEKI